MASFVRDHVNKLTVKNREDEQKKVVLLNRINSSLNQIAKWVNTYKGKAEGARVLLLLFALDSTLERLIKRIDGGELL